MFTRYDVQHITYQAGILILKECFMSSQYLQISKLATTPTKSGKLPVSPATIWRWVREGKFPKPIKLGDRITAWAVEDVEAFIAQRAGASK